MTIWNLNTATLKRYQYQHHTNHITRVSIFGLDFSDQLFYLLIANYITCLGSLYLGMWSISTCTICKLQIFQYFYKCFIPPFVCLIYMNSPVFFSHNLNKKRSIREYLNRQISGCIQRASFKTKTYLDVTMTTSGIYFSFC